MNFLYVNKYLGLQGNNAWRGIAHTTWQSILKNAARFEIDSFGLKGVAKVEQVDMFRCFRNIELLPLGLREYEPHSGSNAASVMTFNLDDTAKGAILTQPIDNWTQDSDELPTDEIILFDRAASKIVVVPWEGVIIFRGFSQEQFDVLWKHGAELAGNLYAMDMQPLR